MDRNKLRKIVLEELQGRSRPKRRRQGFGLIDLLSESSETNLLSLADGIIINSGFEISELSEAVKPNGEPYPPEVVARAQELHAASGDPTLDPDDFLTQAEQELATSGQDTAPPPAPEPAPPDVVDAPTEETQADPDADANAADDAANAAEGAAGETDGTTHPPADATQPQPPSPPEGAAEAPGASAVSDGRDNDDGADGRTDPDPDDPDTDDLTGGGDVDGDDSTAEDEPEQPGTPPAETATPVSGQTKTTEEMKQAIQASIKNFGAATPQKANTAPANESFHKRKLADLLYGSW